MNNVCKKSPECTSGLSVCLKSYVYKLIQEFQNLCHITDCLCQ